MRDDEDELRKTYDRADCCLVRCIAAGIGSRSAAEAAGPAAHSAAVGGVNSDRGVLDLVCQLEAVSRVRAVIESTNSDICSGGENWWTRVSGHVHLQHSAGDVRAARGAGRH